MNSQKQRRHYSYLFILGANVKKDSRGQLVMAETDRGWPLLSEWRLMAAKKLLEQEMVGKIIIVGAEEENIADQEIWRSEVMRDLLINKYGVDRSKIEAIKQEDKGTKGNIKEIKLYIEKNSISVDECAFLTNFYHIPRAIAYSLDERLIMRSLAAECFFIDSDTKTIKIDYGIEGSEFSCRFIQELNGLRDLEFGK